jgi:hypothetical protein
MCREGEEKVEEARSSPSAGGQVEVVRTNPAGLSRSRSALSFSGFGVTADAFSQQQERTGFLGVESGFGVSGAGALVQQQQDAAGGAVCSAATGVTKAKQHHPGGKASSRAFVQTRR